jgi:type III secretory pathway component EscR
MNEKATSHNGERASNKRMQWVREVIAKRDEAFEVLLFRMENKHKEDYFLSSVDKMALENACRNMHRNNLIKLQIRFGINGMQI